MLGTICPGRSRMIDIGVTDTDRRIFRDELAPWLPDRLFDAHVHVFPKDAFTPGYVLPAKSCYRKFGCEHTFEQCLFTASALLPGIEFSMLAFGTPGTETNRDRAADYLGNRVDNRRFFGLALVSPKDSVADIEHRIRKNHLLGYKPYRNLVTWKPAEEVTINDMLPAEQMALADDLGLAVMLHIPRSRRLADPRNQAELADLCRNYPHARIIVAHIGRAYYLWNIIGNIEFLAEYPNAYVDLAMLNHPDVIEYTLRHFPTERILFGSDAPIAWLRGKSVEINNQYAYIMGEDFRIGTAVYDTEGAVEYTFFFYEILRAMGLAFHRAALSREQIEGICYGNAQCLFSEVAGRLSGTQ